MAESKFIWYWHRWRAMSAAEVLGHCRKKWLQFQDGRKPLNGAAFEPGSAPPVFPALPDPSVAPSVLVDALKADTGRIMAGHWRAFGHLKLQVDDPPRWHKDYFAGHDLATSASAFKLNHRALPAGTDIKLIWELSRWHQLVRLAQAAFVLRDEQATRTCLRWLTDWVETNPPYRGWNWTSALESGMRLIQFAWIHALIEASAVSGVIRSQVQELASQILPAHAWFTWRHRSFGSSANNHLLGELTGLILAVVRWRNLERFAAPLSRLHQRWEREVLAQFAEDGGNREQALNYQLFSWEFCWQARLALEAAGLPVSGEVETRLAHAADFFIETQVESEPWDYGDSDNAFVTPFFADERRAVAEWRSWFLDPLGSPAIHYWVAQWPEPRKSPEAKCTGDWIYYPHTGIAILRAGDWTLRWDLSPLGYLSTAAHGHLDALHLSIWHQGRAIVIDPGTGAYYADKQLRAHLASWQAHNGPAVTGEDFPQRLGPFLWSEHHAQPDLENALEQGLRGELPLPDCMIQRTIAALPHGTGWTVEDSVSPKEDGPESFSVRWQFPPGSSLKKTGERSFLLTSEDAQVRIELDGEWAGMEIYNPIAEAKNAPIEGSGICSPAFRQVAFGPYLCLTGMGHKPCLFRTSFLA